MEGLTMSFNVKYTVIQYHAYYIIQKERPGYMKQFYLKSIYKGRCVWYTDPLWGKTYKTEKSAYSVIDKIITGIYK